MTVSSVDGVSERNSGKVALYLFYLARKTLKFCNVMTSKLCLKLKNICFGLIYEKICSPKIIKGVNRIENKCSQPIEKINE